MDVLVMMALVSKLQGMDTLKHLSWPGQLAARGMDKLAPGLRAMGILKCCNGPEQMGATKRPCTNAARASDLEILMWAEINGCPWMNISTGKVVKEHTADVA